MISQGCLVLGLVQAAEIKEVPYRDGLRDGEEADLNWSQYLTRSAQHSSPLALPFALCPWLLCASPWVFLEGNILCHGSSGVGCS